MRSRIEAVIVALDRFITSERLRLYPVAILIGQIVIVTVMLGIPLLIASDEQNLLPDFAAPWTGARLFLDGRLGDLYDVETQWALQQVEVKNVAPSWFVSPPHVALIYTPLALLSYNAAALIWTAISIVCVIVAIRLMEPFAPRLFAEHRLATTLVLLSSYPVFELLGAGQQSGITLLLMAAGIRLALAEHQALAGIVFALGAIKPQLFVLVPIVLIALRMWKALAVGTTAGVLTLILTHLAFGPDVVVEWLHTIFSPAYSELVQIDQAWKMAGLPALILTFAPPSWAPEVAAFGTFLTIGILSYAIWRIVTWAKADVDPRALWAFAIIATILASPHLVLYDLVLVLIPALYLAEIANNRSVRVSLLLLYFLAWLTGVKHIVALELVWPATLIDLSWVTLPILVLWWELERANRKDTREPTILLPKS